jgi:6-phosphofructokinase 1
MTGRPVLAVAQCGGPTAVLNASLDGVLRAAAATFDLLGVTGGPAGLAAGALRRLGAAEIPPDLACQPGAWLGAGRHQWDEASLAAAARTVRSRNVTHLVLIGGDGTMALARALSHAAGGDLAVAGVPKTVDNDLAGTDHAPGFPSAARFLRLVLPGLAFDQHAMRSLEPVRIIETLGRHTGWLAAAAATATGPDGAPHLVFTPEQALAPDSMLALIDKKLSERGWVLAVLAEGASRALSGQDFAAVNHSRPLYGGAARRLARMAEHSLGVPARGEVLGIAQRATSALVSPRDRHEAGRAGTAAVQYLADGHRDVMVSLHADGTMRPVALDQVAGRSRPLPSHWIPAPEGVSASFRHWIEPLAGPGTDNRIGERTDPSCAPE